MPLSAVDVRFRDGQQNGTTVPPLSAFLCLASVSLSIARSFPTDRSKAFGLSNRVLAESLPTGVRRSDNRAATDTSNTSISQECSSPREKEKRIALSQLCATLFTLYFEVGDPNHQASMLNLHDAAELGDAPLPG
jgi:hypothetical protein